MDAFRLPWGVRLANGIGRSVGGLPQRLASLSPESLKAAAQRATGLSEWGGEDLDAGLRVLTTSLEEEANLHLLGRLALRGELIRLLSNRLLLHADLRQHPEIAQTTVVRPILILGLPRTGTTILHKLLACDPDRYAPPLWQLLRPAPHPRTEQDRAARIRAAQQMTRLAYQIAPQWKIIHPLDALEPEECVFLFRNTVYFFSPAFVPGYVRWLMQQDMTADFEEYRRCLQLMLWERPGQRLVMKNPFNLWALADLLTVFPDACIVQTHRDPLAMLPSFCSMNALARRLHSDQVDLRALGPQWLDFWGGVMDRAMAARDASARPAQFFDVQYADLLHDPLAVVRRMYQHFGDTLTPQAEAHMAGLLQANPRQKHGVHRYSLAEFGLDEGTVHERFSRYTRRFAIPLESKGL